MAESIPTAREIQNLKRLRAITVVGIGCFLLAMALTLVALARPHRLMDLAAELAWVLCIGPALAVTWIRQRLNAQP